MVFTQLKKKLPIKTNELEYVFWQNPAPCLTNSFWQYNNNVKFSNLYIIFLKEIVIHLLGCVHRWTAVKF